MQQSNHASALTTSGKWFNADRLLLVLIAGGHGTTHWYAGLLSVILPLMAKDLGFSYLQVGLLMTGRALLGACGNIATSLAADLGGRRKSILICSVLSVALCYMCLALASELSMVVLLASAAALASNAWHPPAMSLLGERFPRRRGYALGWHGTGANLGQGIAPLAMGALLLALTWRQALYVNVLPGIIVAFVLLRWLPSIDEDVLPRQAGAYWGQLRAGLLQNVALLKVIVLSVLRTMGQQALQSFLPLYLAYELHFSPTLVGAGLALMTFSGSVLEPFSGLLSDRIGRKPVLFTCLFLSALIVWSLTWASGVTVPLLFVALLGLTHFSLRPIIFAFAMDIAPPDIGASTVGFVFTVNQTFAALAPLLVGYLADLYGLRMAFYIFTGVTLLAALWVPFTSQAAIPARQAG